MSTRSFRGVRIIRFGDFELDVRAAELRKHGIRIRLQEQPFRILVMLLDRPGEAVLREEIRRRLWPNDTVVEVSHGINAAVLRLREALGESAEKPRYVETLARRGYRFTGPVEIVLKDQAEVIRKAPVAAPPDGLPPELDTGNLIGQTLSHYRVLDQLGVGGMGVVYRAEDLNLGRQVALKFLPQDLARDAVALGRFQREARAASSLNHPGICTIYGVEECSGQPVIVMELLEGETLAARLAAGPLPFDQVLPLAIQMAAALDAAHRKCIVHRDFKPANVLVTKTGVKVLDFGLAKIQRPAVANAAAPREASHVTREGEILGTLHYMSPEQVQGKEADACGDIFSFGLVLYEMLSGQRAFAGDNPARVMAAILTAEPPPIEAPDVILPVLRRCLAKDPDERWQSARDLKAALEWISAGWRPAAPPVPEPVFVPAPPAPVPDPSPQAAAAPAPPARRVYAIVAAVVAVALLALVLATLPSLSWTRREAGGSSLLPPFTRLPAATPVTLTTMTAGSSTQATRFTVTAPDRSPITRISLSPEGRRIAFRAGSQLFVRSLDSLESRLLEGGKGMGAPFWSADGRFVAVVTDGKLRLVNVDDGRTSTLWDVNTTLPGAWGPDGTILIGVIGDGIFGVHAGTGVATRVTSLDANRSETRHLLPQFLPGGRRFLFVAGSPSPGASMLYAGSLGSSERTPIMQVSSNVAYVQPRREGSQGYLLLVRERRLVAQPFDSAKLRSTGEAFPLAESVVSNAAIGAAVSISDFSAAGNTLAYRGSSYRNDGILSGALADVTVVQNWMAGLKR